MDGTILGQGSFVVPSTIVNQVIAIPSAADWVNVYNFTQYGTAGTASTYNGVRYYWQRGMTPGQAIVEFYVTSATTALSADTLATGGFTIYDPSANLAGSQPRLGNPVATTASSNVTRPIVLTGDTTGLSVGSVVRLSNTAQTDVNGIDFVVGAVTANTSFTLLTASNPLATAPGAIGGAGFYRIVNYPPLYYPAKKTVVKVTQSATVAQVSTAIEHSYTVGQAVRFNIPAVSGMIQLNPTPSNNYQYSTVTSVVDAYNFTIDTNTASYAAFTWPTIAQQPSSFPTVEPIGENSSFALNSSAGQQPLYQGLPVYNANNGVFSDATINTGYYGMILGTGGLGTANSGLTITGPAGSAAADIVYWTCGKADFGGL